MASEQLPSEQQITATSPSSAPAAQDAATSSLPGTGPRERFGEDSSVLKLKGLPYTASEQQIYEFFQGFTVTSVAFVYEPDGRPSGLAFAEFATREEALQAMGRKNGEYMGDRYVKLLHVSKQEMEEQVRLGTSAIPGNPGKPRQQRPPRMMGPDGLNGGGGYPDAGFRGRGGPRGMDGPHAGYMGMGGPPQQQMRGVMHPMGGMGPMGGPPGTHGPHGGMPVGAPPMHGMPPHMALTYQLGNLQLGGGPGPRGPPQMGRGPDMGGYGGPPPHMGGGRPGMGMAAPGAGRGGPQAGGPQAGPGGAAAAAAAGGAGSASGESRTVKIRGLPFRATPLDIFNFFEGYGILAESLQMGLDALGRPSGEAWLSFGSHEEALRAVRERNRHYLGNRYLELSLT